MGWTIVYARVGNAQPVYAVGREDQKTPYLAGSVREVQEITGRRKRSVQVACKEAREEGISHFLA